MTTQNMTVLVTGASGTLGAAVVPRLVTAGFAVRPVSRSVRTGWVSADLRTGAGLPEAVRGAAAIAHLASSPVRPRQTDVAGTRRLVEAAKSAGVRHLLYVSIAGVDRVPYRYYQAKLDTEAVVRASGIPYTVLRATQFHPFVERLLSASSTLGPVITDPSWPLQPVAVEDVADRIAELLAKPATGATFELGGPEVLRTGDLARAWLAARGSRRPIWRVRFPGRMAGAVRAGGLLAEGAKDALVAPMERGPRTWRDYLAGKY